MKRKIESYGKRLLAGILALAMTVCIMPTVVLADAWNPESDSKKLELRFWEDESPGYRFYLNAAARYELETVKAPAFGTDAGEWTVMDLLRGMYTGMDYINHIPSGYFENYAARVNTHVASISGNLSTAKSTEWSRTMLSFGALGLGVTDIGGYDFIDKLSASYKFSYKQGINGPIWELIALNTNNYSLKANPEGAAAGDVNTKGRMIDYIINKEITSATGVQGGWALSGNNPDADITGMALQALAPYYLDAMRYASVKGETSYEDLAKAVERGVLILKNLQLSNGGYSYYGSINSESIVQVLVALTSLNMDPLAQTITLPHINKTVSFRTSGGTRDGVTTDNLLDALLTFWGANSGSSPEIGGFKNVTAGYDGGGGSSNAVNGMATDQALYGLIAYDRFVNGENSLYDMTDMTNEAYKELSADSYTVTFDGNKKGPSSEQQISPYGVITIPANQSTGEDAFVKWNTKADGSGISYYPDELLSMPEHNITLYAQYGVNIFNITIEANDGVISGIEIPDQYSSEDEEILLPTADQISKEGYSFEGWYTNAAYTGSPVTSIPARSYGDKTFYAKWKLDFTGINAFYGITTKLTLGSISIADKENIEKARQLYEDMTADQKKQVTAASYKILTLAEEELATLLANMSEADKVMAYIAVIANPVTLSEEKHIKDARSSYDALEDVQKELVTNYQTLLAAEEQLAVCKDAKAKADLVTEQINAIGTVTLESEEAIVAARTAYSELTEEEQSYITAETVAVLENAENTMIELKNARDHADAVTQMIQAIASVSVDNFKDVYEAQAAYQQLTDHEKELLAEDTVTALNTRLQELTALRNTIDLSDSEYDEVNAVQERISALPNPVTLDDETEIIAIRETVDGYSSEQQLSIENYYVLVKAENTIIQLHEDYTIAQELVSRIDEIGEVTLNKADTIYELRRAYGKLTQTQKSMVSNISVLIAAENTLSVLKYNKTRADKTIDQINSIGTVTLSSQETIAKARAAYDALNDAQKALITAEQLKVLTDAEAEYARLDALRLKEISLDKNELNPEVGDSDKLTVSYDPEDTIEDKTVAWSSSNSKAVTVDQDGNVKAIAVGEAVITARVGKFQAVCRIVVKQKDLTGWVEDEGGWKYRLADGTFAKKQWKIIDGKRYYLKDDGYRATGWLQLDKIWYFMDKDGVMQTGCVYTGGKYYYMKSTGAMYTKGWNKISGKWYYMNKSGDCATGWLKLGKTYYYMDKSQKASMRTGWVKVSGKWYYMNSSGAMYTRGWHKIGSKWYYMKAGGDMAIGWLKLGNSYYYLNSSGAMATGWIKVGGKSYYLYSSGVMAKNCYIGKYYVNGSGAWDHSRDKK